ncbi:hypothetical protein KFE98_03540 [bacterium SCSIO 12741]|nr:hypothetical protein KFE98_03540 [bacterium SCSIO 12741]
MKRIFITLSFAAGLLAMTSCSKCYECRVPVEVRTPDTTYTEYQEESLCTANESELKAKEDDGYTCTGS